MECCSGEEMLPEEAENGAFKEGSGLMHKAFKGKDGEKWRGGPSVLR